MKLNVGRIIELNPALEADLKGVANASLNTPDANAFLELIKEALVKHSVPVMSPTFSNWDNHPPALKVTKPPAVLKHETFIDTKKAAKLLNVSKSALYHWVKANIIPHRRHGTKICFSKEELLLWSEANGYNDARKVQ